MNRRDSDPNSPVPVSGSIPQHNTQQLFIPNAYSSQQELTTEFSLQSVLSVVFRYRFLILISTLASIILSALLTEKIDPVFEGTSMVSIGKYVSPISGPTGDMLRNQSSTGGYIETQLPLLESFAIAELVLSQNPEIRDYIRSNTIPKDIYDGVPEAIRSPEIKLTTLIRDSRLGLSENESLLQQSEVNEQGVREVNAESVTSAVPLNSDIDYGTMSAYLSSVDYERVEKSEMVKITSTARNAGMAALIANAHSQAFIALVRARLLDNARVNLQFLKLRAKEATEKSKKTRNALVDYAEKNALFISLGEENSENQQARNKLYWLINSLTSATKDRAEAEANYRLSRDASSSLAATLNPNFSNRQMELSTKEAELKQLKDANVSRDNFYYENLEFEIKAMKSAMKVDRNAAVKQQEIKYKALAAQEQLLKDEIEKLRKTNVDESKALVRYKLLKSEDEAARSLAKEFNERLEEVYVHLNSNQNHVRLLDEARVPVFSETQRSYINLIIGTILGPILGIALAFALDLLDNTIRTAQDLNQVEPVQFLGTVPRFALDVGDTIAGPLLEEPEPGGMIEDLLPDSAGAFGDLNTGEAGPGLPLPNPMSDTTNPGSWSTAVRKDLGDTRDAILGGKKPDQGSQGSDKGIEATMTGFKPSQEDLNRAGAVSEGTPNSVADPFSDYRQTTSADSNATDGATAHGGTVSGTRSFVENTLLQSDSLVLVSAPNSLESEAFRNIRTCITHGSASEEAKVILVTSGQKGDGKTTVSSNLAISLAQNNERTLLIDCDLRLPTVHKHFNLSRLTPGVGDYLTGQRDYREVIFDTPVPNLCLMLAGGIVASPTELVGSKRMTELLHLLEDEFDRIIIDSPPITRVADTMLLSRLASGVLLVVRSGKTPKPVLQTAFSRLHQMDANILGTVLNDIESIPGYNEVDYYYVAEEFDEEVDFPQAPYQPSA